jgi:predicted transposase/invertase (TIGR01784 family)
MIYKKFNLFLEKQLLIRVYKRRHFMDINNPHDKFFKEIFSDKKRAIELIKIALPKDIGDILNYKNIKNEKTNFFDEKMKEFHSDLLFSIQTIDKTEIKIYLLFEHKSFLDRNINLQMLSYLTRIYLKQKTITPVIPIIFYHGKKEWNIPLNFIDSFNFSENNKKLFSKYIPNFTPEFIDLKKTDIEKIISSLTLKVILYTFKNIWHFEDLKKLKELISLSENLFYEESGIKIIQRLLLYLFSINDIEPDIVRNTISRLISYKKGEEIMTTTAERWINQGIEQGLEQGLEQGEYNKAVKIAGSLLGLLDNNVIAKKTGLSIKEVNKLEENLK